MSSLHSPDTSEPAYHTSSEISQRPLDTKWLEGSGNTVRATVAELKKLLNMELHNSLELSQSLAEAVFPDHNLPIRINQSLLDGPRATRRQMQRSPKSVLSEPPTHWSEANTCQWLNDIGDALRQAKINTDYTNNDGNVVTLPKRIWSSAYSSVCMKKHQGSNGHDYIPRRKPDIVLVDEDFDGDIAWPQVHSLAEVTSTELIKSRTIKDTVYQKSYIMFRCQDNRTFVPSVYFTGEGFFTFNICDRAGIVYSANLEIAGNPLILLRILTGLMFAQPSAIGYDPTIQCNSHGRAVLIRVAGLDYRVKAELFKSTALRGRATRCWSVESTDGNKEGFVLKDCWADVRRERGEILILELIRELGLCKSHCLPTLVHGENVRILLNVALGLYGDDCTARRRGENSSVEGRVHRRLLMKPLGRHLTDFRCLHELVGAVIDAVEAHRALFSNGILHRDISINNVMIMSCGDSGIHLDKTVHWDHGLLIDFDYSFLYTNAAKKLGEILLRMAKEGRNDLAPLIEAISKTNLQDMDNSNEVLLHRTGTFPFMSIQLLTAGTGKIEHTEKHDLESFFWVLLYICTMFEGPGKRRVNAQRTDPEHPFGHWLGKMNNLEELGENVTAYGIGSFRNVALGRPNGPKDLLERFVDPHFKPLIPMLEALCDKVFLTIGNDETLVRVPTTASGDYEGILDILKNALEELPVHGPLPPLPSGEVDRDTAIMPPPPGLVKIGQHRGSSWDSGYGEGETSRSGSLRGRRAVASTGDVSFVDGKRRRSMPSPDKTTATRGNTSSPAKHASHSSKRSNNQPVIKDTSSSSSKRRKAG